MEDKVFQILKWNAVAHWVCDSADQCCSICKESFQSVCPRCSHKDDPTIACNIVRGDCMHSYHQHCLQQCFNRTSTNKCLHCRATWNQVKSYPVDR